MISVGLVGIGDAGRQHARALLRGIEGVRWSAVVGRDPAKLEAFRVEHQVPREAVALSSLDALLDVRACDAVILATPDGLHAEQVIRCAQRGLHVLVEKPLALDAADAKRAIDACRAAGVVLGVGYQLRHHAAHGLVRARREELIGPLRAMHLRWAWPDPAVDGWRARGQGARWWSLAALGTHAIDLASWIAGAPALEARGIRAPAGGVDRTAEVSLRFADDVLAHVSVAVTHRAISRVTITGDRGELECLGTLGARGDGSVTLRPVGEEPRAIPFEPVDPHAAQLAAFVDRVRARDLATAPDALANVELLDAISRG